jgi:hypothetical protein
VPGNFGGNMDYGRRKSPQVDAPAPVARRSDVVTLYSNHSAFRNIVNDEKTGDQYAMERCRSL